MFGRPSPRRVRVAALLLVATTVACSAEADLIAYFGSPRPAGTLAPGATPSAGSTAVPTASGNTTPGATPSVQPTGTAGSQPTLSGAPTATPAWSPLPTRPPGLADFATLRERAEVTDVGRLAANPGLAGSTVYFEGRVNEVTDSGDGRIRARVKVGEAFVLLVFRTDRYWGDHPLVQGDRIRVVGEFVGMSGGDQALPEIEPIDLIHRFA